VAEQLTGVLPIANVLPEAGTQVTVTGPSTWSLALAGCRSPLRLQRKWPTR
jgi:hypothetical protein